MRKSSATISPVTTSIARPLLSPVAESCRSIVAKTDWTTDGQVLPPYGFVAKAGENEAGITRRDGLVSAYAKSPGTLFVDARPDIPEGEGEVTARVAAFDDLGNHHFRLRIDWQVLQPPPEGYKGFLHFVDDKPDAPDEGILFQGTLEVDQAKLATVGSFSTVTEAVLPADVPDGSSLAIRFGLFHAGADGHRLPMLVASDETDRVRGGHLLLKNSAISWQPPLIDPNIAERAARLNMTNRMIDFGSAVTNGAFRLLYSGKDWQLIPLPNSAAFKVELHLDKLNAAGKKIAAVTGIDMDGKAIGEEKFQQDGPVLRFAPDAKVFAYQISLAN